MTSKLHGVCHSKGGPLRLHLREGQCSDFTGADGVLKGLPPTATVMGDQGYDRGKIRKLLAQQGIPPCIPPRHCRKKPVHYNNKRLDRRRHKIETLFSRQKDWRPIATRYRRLRPPLPFCHPPGRHWPLLVMSPDPSHHWPNTLARKALTDSVFTVEISLKRNPLPLTIQRREQADAEALLQTLGGAITSQRPELLHLSCDTSSERKILLLSNEIAAVQMYERSSGSSGRTRRPGFSRDA